MVLIMFQISKGLAGNLQKNSVCKGHFTTGQLRGFITLYWPFMNRFSPGPVACLMKCLRMTMLTFLPAIPAFLFAQQGTAINDLQNFNNVGASWKMAANIAAAYSNEIFTNIT